MKKLYIAKLTYHDPYLPFAPSSFYGISNSKKELKDWALAKWNEVMLSNKQETFEGMIRFMKLRQGYSNFSLYERMPNEIQMRCLVEECS